MLFIRHPQPVVDSRPVVELSVRCERPKPAELALLCEAQNTGPAPLHELRPSSAASRSVPAADVPIRFTVSYGLREYLAVLTDYLPIALREIGRPCERLGWGAQLAVALVATPKFLYKKWRIGDCHFEIDALGLSRHSRSGPLVVPWGQVLEVHRLSNAYLVGKDTGKMPLPYRCLSRGERARFEGWAAAAGVLR